MSQKHSPEPWTTGEQHESMITLWAADKRYVGTMRGSNLLEGIDGHVNYGTMEANARRVLACVNFCRDFPTESLEGRSLVFIEPGTELRSAADIPGFDGFVAATLLPVAKDAT